MSTPPPARPPDPVYLTTRRESVWIIAIWIGFAAWCLGYSLTHGYANPGADVLIVFGFPHWVFWGVAMPWIFASATTLYVSLKTLSDDPLEPLAEDKSPAEEIGTGEGSGP